MSSPTVPAAPAAPGVSSADGSRSAAGDLTDALIATDWWTDEMVTGAGIPIVDSRFVSIGGGMASFVLVDLLRIAGVPTDQIRVLTADDYPWQTYEHLTRCSQIPLDARIRSDSSSMPDNFWGFPSLILREAWRDKTLAPLWSGLTEPLLTDYWAPQLRTVLEGMAKEAKRIDWFSMAVKGPVRMVRRRAGGGYFTIITPPAGATPTKRVAFRSQFTHLGVGHPGVKFLDDLQAYRTAYDDRYRVVNAYEPHEHVYEELRRRPGVVVIRGNGVVASRVLQRLMDERKHHGAETTILHVFGNFVSGPKGDSVFMRRPGGNGWSYQGFDYPKAAWGGQHWDKCRKLDGDERAEFYKLIGGANTPRRKAWVRAEEQGRREGWYRLFVGTVEEVVPGNDGTLVSRIRDPKTGAVLEAGASFIIDCTGLEADIREHRVIADLLDHGGAGRNPLGRLDVTPACQVRGVESDPGRLYATGSMTLGGYFCGVDTFLGLQLSAVDVVDDLSRVGFCRRIGVRRSVSQWWRRVRDQAP